MNNPLRYIDPSGENWLSSLIREFVIVIAQVVITVARFAVGCIVGTLVGGLGIGTAIGGVAGIIGGVHAADKFTDWLKLKWQ